MVKEAECIRKLGENPSKAQEIFFISHIAGSLPENSYLKSFFSSSMLRKLEQNIQNDFCSDFDEMLEQMVNERLAMKKEQMEEQYKRDVEEMQNFTKMAEERVKKYEEEAKEAKREYNRVAERLQQIHQITSGY